MIRLRVLRAGGLFVTSLGASAALAIGPAVVMARLTAGTPVIVEPSVAPPLAASALGAAWRGPAPACRLGRGGSGVRARSLVVVAGSSGAPRGGPRHLRAAARGVAAGASGVRRAAPRGDRWRGGGGDRLAPALRQRPPPAAADRTAPRRFTSRVHVPATLPTLWRCVPDFSLPTL